MTLTDRKLNIVCVAAVVLAFVLWLFGVDPLFGLALTGVVVYGFHNLEDILSQRVAEAEEDRINEAIELAVAAHNQDINDSLSLFCEQVTTHTAGFSAYGEHELQGVDEWGRPDPIRLPEPVARYFPLRMAQTSIASNYVLSEKMTVQDLNDRLNTMFIADSKWLRRQLLSALFTASAYNFRDPQYGTVAISVLANGDAETYLRAGSGAVSVDTHHKGAATFTISVLQDIYNELSEHEENGGEEANVVVFIPTASKATVQGFDSFVAAPDPNVTLGTAVDQYTGSFAEVAPGTPIGYDEDAKVHIREWSRLPDDYAIGVADTMLKPLAMRQDPEPSLQGFGEIPGRTDMPYLQRLWSRRAGFAAYNRVGAVVYRTNNATYAAPSGYAAPL